MISEYNTDPDHRESKQQELLFLQNEAKEPHFESKISSNGRVP